jgi:type VI secretion system protein ImpF
LSDRPGANDSWVKTRGPARLSLLDRLIDADPDARADPPLSAAETLTALRNNVRSDLEALLNARRRWCSWDKRLAELATSPVGYGLPDFTSGSFNNPKRREEVRAEIEATIRRFEPRFVSVNVTLAGGADALSTTLRLRIDALLHAEPAPEPVAFDTLFDPSTADILVRAEEG